MALITGKTIYILGAGASYHTGAPLLKDFLARARSLMASDAQLVYRQSFENVFKWIDKLRAPAYYLEIDLDNLEHIFSLISMMQEVEDPEANNLYKDISFVIFETLDHECKLDREEDHIKADDIYQLFCERLDTLNEERQKRSKRDNPAFSKDVIISLNYDVMLDYAMHYFSRYVDYCLRKTNDTGKWKLLKLHGSMNWGIHAGCPKKAPADPLIPQIVDPSPIPPGHMLFPTDKPTQFPFRMVTHTLAQIKCNLCQQKGVLMPLFIPPTWTKSPRREGMQNVWAQAVEEFKTAFQIVVIGYSLPITDTFLPYLLTLGLSHNPSLYRITVIDPDAKGEVKKRYEETFSRSLVGRGRLKFVPITFETFVKQQMETLVENME